MLDIANAQLEDKTFATSPQGKALRRDLLHRAIYLKDWALAESLFARAPHRLSAAERQQWFDVLIAGQLDDRLLALQAKGIFNDPQRRIDYASTLAQRGETARLAHYLAENQPVFLNAEQEKSWLYLLSHYSQQPRQALMHQPVQFAQNRRYVVGTTLPELLKSGITSVHNVSSICYLPGKCQRSAIASVWRLITASKHCNSRS